MPSLSGVVLKPLVRHISREGELTVVEVGKDVPFKIMRSFTIRATGGVIRGQHAHKHCAQFMICQAGVVEVICDDGKKQKQFMLDRFNLGLLVPPGIWASERFLGDHTILDVLCDRLYDENDYIRDYADFLAWRNTSQ
jgi:dTDP-4-dehydrorhamnose 3,5-epimerase-like enzyme